MTELYHKTKTLHDAHVRCRSVNAKWRSKLTAYLTPLFSVLKRADCNRLEALLGLQAYGGPIRASDLAARRQFGLLCANVVHAYSVAVPSLRWFHITLLDDELHTAERAPGLALKRVKAKAYKELQELGLNAVAWIDVDPLPNYPQEGKGGTFMFHVHAIGFTDQHFDVAEKRGELKQSRRWSCVSGVPPTTISEITRSKGTPGWWAQYDAKPPYRAKSRRELTDGRVELRWTEKNYRGQLAMRLTEGLAQIAMFDTFFAVGEGKDLREEVRKRLMKWHRKRWPDRRPTELGDLALLFQRLWAARRVRSYQPWSIIGASV